MRRSTKACAGHPATGVLQIAALPSPDEENVLEMTGEEKPGLYRILWVKAGAGRVLVDLNCFAIEKDTVYIIEPGQKYRWHPEGCFRGYLILASADVMRESSKLIALVNTSCPHTPGERDRQVMADEVEDLLQLLATTANNERVVHGEILADLLQVVLLYLTRICAVHTCNLRLPENNGVAKRYIELIEKNITRMRKVSDYAGELGVTASHLNQLIKKASGFPASYHIQRHLVLEAQRLGSYSGFKIKETAHHLGFEDAAHFCKFFKRKTGRTFTEFRTDFSRQMQYHGTIN